MAAGRRIIKTSLAGFLSSADYDFKECEPMSKHTTLCLGGVADYFVTVRTAGELKGLLKTVNEKKIPFYVIGGGSNILFPDEGFRGAVIRLAGEFCGVEITGASVTAGAGALLSSVVKKSGEHSLAGLEKFVFLPGTVGGAVYGNAGLKDVWIDSVIDETEVMTYEGRERTLKRKDMNFEYRKSGLKNCVVTRVRFVLKNADKNDILKNASKEIDNRIFTQPLGTKNAGCIFKNPQGASAGRLIDSLGFKGYRSGGICVSEIHANFFVNDGSGTSEDMRSLIDLIRNAVKEKYNLNLETEIKIIK